MALEQTAEALAALAGEMAADRAERRQQWEAAMAAQRELAASLHPLSVPPYRG